MSDAKELNEAELKEDPAFIALRALKEAQSAGNVEAAVSQLAILEEIATKRNEVCTEAFANVIRPYIEVLIEDGKLPQGIGACLVVWDGANVYFPSSVKADELQAVFAGVMATLGARVNVVQHIMDGIDEALGKPN